MRRDSIRTGRSCRARSRDRSCGPTTPTLRRRALKVAQRLEQRGLRPWRSHRDACLEHRPPHRGLVRHHGHRRGLPHAQSATVPGADRLDHEPRRGQGAVRRPDLPAAGREDRPVRQVAEAGHRPDRRRAFAEEQPAQRRRLSRSGWPRPTATSPGRASTSTRRPACATRRAPPAIPKGVLYSHRSNVLHAMIAAMPDAMGISVARRRAAGRADVPCQCLGPCPELPDDRRQAGHARRQDGWRVHLRAARHREGDLHRRRADRLADAAASTSRRPARSCPI